MTAERFCCQLLKKNTCCVLEGEGRGRSSLPGTCAGSWLLLRGDIAACPPKKEHNIPWQGHKSPPCYELFPASALADVPPLWGSVLPADASSPAPRSARVTAPSGAGTAAPRGGEPRGPQGVGLPPPGSRCWRGLPHGIWGVRPSVPMAGKRHSSAEQHGEAGRGQQLRLARHPCWGSYFEMVLMSLSQG